MKYFTRIAITFTLFLSLLSFSTISSAKERWYQIEVIAIEHKDQSGVSLEEWPAAPGLPQSQNAYLLQPASDSGLMTEFTKLNDNELELTEAKDSLVSRTGNRIILHTAWRQKLDENEQTSIRLLGGQAYNLKGYRSGPSEITELDGTLTISRNRFLHVKSDLIFHEPVIVLNQSTHQSEPTHKVKPIPGSANWDKRKDALLKGFRLQTNSKLKKNEVVYLDHPAFGILIKISDAKAPASS